MISWRGFAWRLAILWALVCAVAAGILLLTVPGALPVALGALSFGALLTLAAFALNVRGLLGHSRQFLESLLGALALKLFLSIGFVTAIALGFRPWVVPLVIAYFSSYLLFTAFEVWALLNNLRANSKSDAHRSA